MDSSIWTMPTTKYLPRNRFLHNLMHDLSGNYPISTVLSPRDGSIRQRYNYRRSWT
jgi:hypothetical protein